jgi:hypothetical protein
MEFTRWHRVVSPKASVAMHAQGLVVMTTIGVPPATGVAMLAVQVRLDAAPISGTHRRNPVTDAHHFDTQFVPRNPRVGEEGHLAQVTSEVGAANAHLMNADHGLTRAGSGGFVDIDDPE